GNSGDRGGAISVVADLDLDGRLEVVAGNTVYRHDGAVAWTSPLPDGYPAVADFDDDPRPEIVVVAAGTVRLHDSDGALLWGPLPLPGSDPEAGGAPTVGDFDGDGRPEIGVAGSDVYVVFDGDGSILWQASTQDYSSNLTGSTSFDLDGDGALEIVYRDERRLRIYRGLDGVVLFEMPISSNTWTEEPIVVDVDRDGNAEIVVSSDRAPDVALPPGERTSGLFVLGDGGDGWISARGIWHQHAYSPEQIEEDARVPASPAWGWLDHNSFRANVPRSAEPWAGPDLTASRIVPDLTALPDVAVTVRIGNGGRVPIGPGLEVAFYDGDPTFGGLLVGTATLGAGLDAGGFVDVATHLQIADLASGRLTVVADDDGGGSGRERECDEANNSASVLLDTSPLGLWLELDDGVDSLGAGDPTTYAIQVHNAYPAEATGVVLTDILPEHTTLLAASDGGEVAAGVVTWPPTSIPPGARIVRTLTLEVDAAIPFAVNSIVNQASVTDDGAQGPDPTPENNLATDTDQVTTVTADAGGPYSAAEGAPILLDGSGSFDRDGTIVAYAWDLDGDGIFGDASGPLVSWTPPGEGVWPLALEVTDDSGESDTDATQATVGNEPPVVTGPTELVGVEGTPVSLEAVHCSDPNDPLTATVDWGDGTVEATAIVGGVPVATHRYPDDGTYPLSICVSDGSAPEVCIAPTAQIANAAPEVLETVGFDFQSWSPTELGGGATTAWSISTGGRVATESSNGEPTFLVGEMDSFGTYELSLRVADPADDDFVGLAFGFEPDDLTDPTARYFLLDWRRWYQSGATPGLALSEVTGIPSTYELWLHEDQANNGPSNGVREIARAATLGAIGWDRHRDYRFRIEHSPSHLRVWVDDSLELDVEAAFQPGRLALYDYSQAQAIFTALESRVTLVGFEGEPASLVARFTDAGIADTHVAHITWGDGATESISPAEENGAGEIAVGHVYADDGTPALEVCVDDDDGATDCQPIPARIWNRPPRLALAVASTGFLDDPVSLDGTTFTDPGTLDSHTATVDWGDGTVEPAIVLPTGTGGSVGGSHLYPTPGTFAVRLCVVDDDGDSDCDEVSVSVVERRLDLGVSIASDVSGVRPGAVVGLNVVGENHGSLPATGVVTTATVPPHTTFLTASDGGTVAQGVVTWPLGPLAPTETASRRFEVSVDLDAPVGGTLVAEASIADDGLSGPDAVPANDHAVAELHVSGPLTPIVELPYAPAGVEGLPLSLLDATWNDTTANEAHTGTVDWGDGLLESVTLTPSRGVAGAIAATHTYLEDGVYTLTVCVRDAQGNVGCAAREATVVNAPPILVEPGAVLLDYWLDEQYDNFAGDLRAEWIVAADGLSVRQRINSRPSIFLSPLPAFDTTLEGTIRVGSQGNWDDDFIGFVLGFRPGDTRNAGADFLLVDWKQASQWGARRGLALSRVSGIPAGDEFWIHSGHLTELARGFTLGDRGWADNREYRFRFEYSSDRLRLWVDDVLQFDLEGDFPDGNFGFYNYSQQDVYYRGFSSGLDVRYEGEELELRAPFVDPGVLDTHQGTVDWDDGQSEALAAQSSDGFGLLAATHGYDDDGDFSIAVCIEDDEHAEDCGTFPLVVQNLPPIVVPAQTSPAIANAPWSGRLATFTDPGRLDSHVAEVDWGDGMRTPGQVTDDAGAGIVEGAHTWSAAGTFETEVCVLDDDGGEGCELVTVVVLDSPPSLRANKTYTAIDRDGDGVVGPGDDLLYRIEISNSGPTAATGVVLVDPVPAHTSLVPGSATPALLVTESDPLVAEIPRIESGASLVVQFAVAIDPSLPAGVSEIVNSGIVE
ncbi:MAG: DUF11 domain-containing protein, partial [Acidobacteria bacterium]|nr:DUF11 domain-containing protein [Acidobacteriota bacterium]